MYPARCAFAIVEYPTVDLPLDSGPYNSTTQPKGNPPNTLPDIM